MPIPEGAVEITGDMRAVIQNIANNSKVQRIDTLVQEHTEPEIQMAILMLAVAKCFARIRRKHNITGPRRRFVLKKTMEDFEAKIRKFGFEDRAEEVSQNHTG